MRANFGSLLILSAFCLACNRSEQRSTASTNQIDSIHAVDAAVSTQRADSTASTNTDVIATPPIENTDAQPQSPQTSSALPIVSLINWKFFMGGDGAAKVEVRFGTSADTLPDLFAVRDPLVTKDGMVHGISTSEDGGATGGFDYDPATRKLTRFPLPKDVNPSFPDLELNESASWVAYIAHSSGYSWAVVRTWPRLELVAKSDSSPGYPSDADTDVVGWADSTHFNLRYVTHSGAAVMVTGDARARTIKIDSVTRADLLGN